MRYCPRCYLTDDDIGSCGNFAVGCPPAVEAEPDKVAHVSCGPCGKEVAIPIANIMRGKLGFLSGCSTDSCPARLILPEAASPATTLPAPLSESPLSEDSVTAADTEAAIAEPQGETSDAEEAPAPTPEEEAPAKKTRAKKA